MSNVYPVIGVNFLYKHHKNSFKNKNMSKSGFFLSRSHMGRDSGFLSKMGRIPTR